MYNQAVAPKAGRPVPRNILASEITNLVDRDEGISRIDKSFVPIDLQKITPQPIRNEPASPTPTP